MKKRSNWKWLLPVLALILVNYLASLAHMRFDLTQEKRYTLSQPLKQLLREMKKPVTVEVFMKGEFPAGFRKLTTSVEEFLHECKEYSRGQLQVQFTDPLKGLNDSAAKNLIDSIGYFYDIPAFTLQAPGKVGDEQTQKLVLPGAVLHYGDTTVGVNLLKGERSFGTEPEQLAALYNNVEASMEYKFGTALEKILAGKKASVGYLLGHGEGWGYNVDDMVRTLIKNYSFDTVNLRTTPAIPNYDALVVAKPVQAFSDQDKMKLDQYVMHGGRVFWMIDNMYAEFDSLYKSQGFIAFDRGLNLEDLLFNYGVRMNQNLLQDMQCDQLPQVSTNGSEQRRLVDWPFFPLLNGTEHPISRNMDPVRLMFPTTIDTVEAEGIRKTFLLTSSNNARVLEAPARIDFEFLQIAPDARAFTKKQVPVAVLLEGNFRSLYNGRIPAAYRDSLLRNYQYNMLPAAEKPGRMILVADGDLAMNQYSQVAGALPMGMNVFTRYTYANKEFFMNALDYLIHPSGMLQTRSKAFTLRLLDPRKTADQRTTWQLLTVGLPILLVIIIAMGYQQWRKRRYTASA